MCRCVVLCLYIEEKGRPRYLPKAHKRPIVEPNFKMLFEKAQRFHDMLPKGEMGHEHLQLFLDELAGSHSVRIGATPFGTMEPIISLFEKERTSNRRVRLSRALGPGVWLFNLTFTGSSNNQSDTLSGDFIISRSPAHESSYILYFIDAGDFYSKSLNPVISKLFPQLVLTTIKTDQMRGLIELYKQSHGLASIRIRRASQQLRFHNSRPMSAVVWPNMSTEEAFAFLHENNGWFKRIEFESYLSDTSWGRVSITRNGTIRTTLRYRSVGTTIIRSILDQIDSDIVLFSNRTRIKEENFNVKPLSIVFMEPLFESVDVNKSFIEQFRTIRNASVSVIHGNPYVHMQLLDYYDGSSYDVWVIESNRVDIVPQTKSSAGSIERITKHVFNTFAEGDVREYVTT